MNGFPPDHDCFSDTDCPEDSMNPLKFAREWRLKREIDASLRQRRMARLARSQAAQRGHSNHIKRLAAQTREMFS